jgi:integral membrane protein (TIGR00529 family)
MDGHYLGILTTPAQFKFKRTNTMTEMLNTIPAIVRIAAIFVVMLLAIRRNVSLGNALTGGALLTGLFFGMQPLAILQSAFLAMVHPKTLALAVVVMLILVLSHSMETAGQMNRLLDSFGGLVKHPGLNLIIFPALIGLLPMPGGAIFSAPMVKNLGGRQAFSGAQLSYINYWFRHIWEYWWPLYPGVLLTTAIAGLNLWSFVLFMLPLTVVAGVAGYWPLVRIIGTTPQRPAVVDRRRPRPKVFFMELLPISTVIVLGLGLGWLFSRVGLPYGGAVAKEAGLIAALVVAIGWVWQSNRLSGQDKRMVLLNPKLFGLFYMVAGILIFKGLLEDSRAIGAVSSELTRWDIPLVTVSMLLPLLVGVVAGITIAFVGTTFPILISLIQALGQEPLMLPYMMMALASGFVGVLLSPLHLCLLLSNSYFQTNLNAVYRHLWLPCATLLASGWIYFHLSAWWLAG